jgi:hypothetical protein
MGAAAGDFLPVEIFAADLQSARWSSGDLAEATNPAATGAASVFHFATPVDRSCPR